LKAALALFSSDPRFEKYVGANDCDYKHIESVGFRGRLGVATWLRERFADRDRMTMSSMRLIDRAPDSDVAGPSPVGATVEYARRTSKTLQALGFPRGIKPQGATKIGFTTAGPVRMTQFANGPGTGDPMVCKPEAAG